MDVKAGASKDLAKLASFRGSIMPKWASLNGSVGISFGGSVKRKRRHPNGSVAFRGSDSPIRGV